MSARLIAKIMPMATNQSESTRALAGWIFGYIHDEDELTSMQLGHSLALEVLKIKGAVDTSMNNEKLYQVKKIHYNE